MIAETPELLENLVVCLTFPTLPRLNRGECEKCVRTMVTLLAIGAFAGRGSSPSAM